MIRRFIEYEEVIRILTEDREEESRTFTTREGSYFFRSIMVGESILADDPANAFE